MRYKRPHHQAIGEILQQFDATFLEKHHILFGGGTRISLELNEYRESVDIDFFVSAEKPIGPPSLAAAPQFTLSVSDRARYQQPGQSRRGLRSHDNKPFG